MLVAARSSSSASCHLRCSKSSWARSTRRSASFQSCIFGRVKLETCFVLERVHVTRRRAKRATLFFAPDIGLASDRRPVNASAYDTFEPHRKYVNFRSLALEKQTG